MRIPAWFGLIIIFLGQLLYMMWKIQNSSQDEPHLTTWIFSMLLILLGLCLAAKNELTYISAAVFLLLYIIINLGQLHDVALDTDLTSLKCLTASIALTGYAVSRQHKMRGNWYLVRPWMIVWIPFLCPILLHTGWTFIFLPPVFVAWIFMSFIYCVYSDDIMFDIFINFPYLLYLAVSFFALIKPSRTEPSTPENSVNISDLFNP